MLRALAKILIKNGRVWDGSKFFFADVLTASNIETLYQAAMMDPRTGMCLSTDEIVAMCDELIEAHTKAGYPIF